jgi:excisionase family DNA binding protein
MPPTPASSNSSIRAGGPTAQRRPPINVTDAALYMGLPERFIRRLVAERRIPFIKVAGTRVRFIPEDLDEWILSQRVEPKR